MAIPMATRTMLLMRAVERSSPNRYLLSRTPKTGVMKPKTESLLAW